MADAVKVYTDLVESDQDRYCTVIAGRNSTTSVVIQLTLRQMSIYEDPSFYDLQEFFTTEPSNSGRILEKGENPLVLCQKWSKRRWRGEIKLKLRRRSEKRTDLAMQRLIDNLSPDIDNHLTDDMCNLSELSESSMLATIRTRFEHNKIYTYVGSILIALNPYFFFPIYNPNYRQKYEYGKLGDFPPHVFAVASEAYQSLLADKEDQAVIISGESGAGKTESTKFLLHHLMNLSAKFEDEKTLELITLGTGPVLEAFGNAKTLSNDNSSRFGKFIVVRFRENGAYYSASIQQYLLERSRIVLQAEHERNYHVFYYLLSGASKELKSELHLDSLQPYHYLTHGLVRVRDVHENQEFQRLQRSLTMLGLSDPEQTGLFGIVATILHLGNIDFHRDDSDDACCEITTPSILTLVANMMKVDESTLRLALTTRRAKAGDSEFVVQYKLDEAADTRDAMAKALYGAVFDWIVARVNIALIGGRARHRHRGNTIGVLDIFGFEVYDENSFEQFCINYANEQLQQYFNKHVFKSEQEEYVREGINWNAVTFIDNCDCLDLIARKPTGLLHLLNEESSFPGADANSLYDKFERQHKKHQHYKSPPVRQENPYFIIVHYAGDVLYRVKGFREKNRDRMRPDIVEVLKTSRNDLVRSLIGLPTLASCRWRRIRVLIAVITVFRQHAKEKHKKDKVKTNSLSKLILANSLEQNKVTHVGRHKKVNKQDRKFSTPIMLGKGRKASQPLGKQGPGSNYPRTVSSQFHSSLASLMETLEVAKPYFVRCIKSNAEKAPRVFDEEVVLRQLRYTGMLQTIRIRKSGYPVRIGFEDFYEKYHFLMGPREADLKAQIARCLDSWGFSPADCDLQIGRNKVFMREEHKQLIQECLQAKVLDRIVLLQKWFRGNIARIRFLAMRRSSVTIQSHVRGWLGRLKCLEMRRQVSAAVVLQAWWRGVRERRRFYKVASVVLYIQRWWRNYQKRKRKQQELLLKHQQRPVKPLPEQEPIYGNSSILQPHEAGTSEPLKKQSPSPEKEVLPPQPPANREPKSQISPPSRPKGFVDSSSSTTSICSTKSDASSLGRGETGSYSSLSLQHSYSMEFEDVSESGPSPLHRRRAVQDKKGSRLRVKVSPTHIQSTTIGQGQSGPGQDSLDRILLSPMREKEENTPKSPESPGKWASPVRVPTKTASPTTREHPTLTQSLSAAVEKTTAPKETKLRRSTDTAMLKPASDSSSANSVAFGSPKKPKRQGSKQRNIRPVKKAAAMATHFFRTHMFKRGQKCAVCSKVFSGFLKQGLQCEACKTGIHHHCVNRVHVCSAHIQEGRRLTFSTRKVLASLSDLDDFDAFIMGKIGSMRSEEGSSIGGVFKVALVQFHTTIVSNLSLKTQAMRDVDRTNEPNATYPERVSATFDQLTIQFTGIIKGLAKTHSLHEGHVQVVVLQFKNFLEEFSTTRRSRDIKRRYSQVPVLKDGVIQAQPKSPQKKRKEIYDYKGHSFVVQTFNVLSVCEFCETQMPVLSQGVVCSVCSYTCHDTCFKKVKKCKGKQQQQHDAKTPDSDEAIKIQTMKLKTQFGIPLKKLVPGKVVRVPVVLERLLEHVEANGIHTQGIYRKTPSPSNKAALKAALDKDPLGASLADYQINSSAALIKNFLQSLPQPLMTFELYREFMLSTELTDPVQQLRTIHQLIERMPELNHCILERLFFHLAIVAKAEESNLMDPNNLSIIFAPCLFRSKKDPKPQDLVKELSKAHKVLHVIISEQLERLNANLEHIAKFSSAAITTATQLQELMEGQDPYSPLPSPLTPTTPSFLRPSSTIEQLTVELQYLEKERAEWTAQLPRLKPFETTSSEDLTQSISDEDRSATPSSLTSLDSDHNGTPDGIQKYSNTKKISFS